MTQFATPNPIEMYQQATTRTGQIIAGVKPDQLGKPTPCSEWDVQQLIEHLVGGTYALAGGLTGGQPQPPEGLPASEACTAGVLKVLEGARKPGSLEQTVPTPRGPLPAGQFVSALWMDSLIHGWDLAKATGQDTTMDAEQVETCYQVFSPHIEWLRQGGGFGPEVKVAPDAGMQEKLLGMMGHKA